MVQFPTLTPLQSRFAASLLASLILVILYFTLISSSGPLGAYADELDSVLGEDHNHRRIARHAGHDGGAAAGWDAEGYSYDDLEDDANENKHSDGAQRDQEEPWEELLRERAELSREADGETRSYEAQFFGGFDRGIVGRAENGVMTLVNNIATNLNGESGGTDYWIFPNASVWGNHTQNGTGLPSALTYDGRSVKRAEGDSNWSELEEGEREGEEASQGNAATPLHKRQSSKTQTVYISINVCLQPQPNPNRTATVTGSAPQMTMYISTNPQNTKPGPDSKDQGQVRVVLQEGFAQYGVSSMSDVNVAVFSPKTPTGFTGFYNYDIAASIDGPYHSWNGQDPFLFLVDSDTTSALLVTDNLTQALPDQQEYKDWMGLAPPFRMFAFNTNQTSISGLTRSYCGLKKAADAEGLQVDLGMTSRGLGNKPKEQFYIQGLNGSSAYLGFLAMEGNSTNSGDMGQPVVGGGGQVWRQMNFTTKADNNCQVIFNLSFCSEVAYAVPSNPELFPSSSSLAALYDDNAQSLYKNFSYSLQQIPCNTTNTAQYSLARTCADCDSAYKTWLCAVSIPRCADFSTPNLPQWGYLVPRNVGADFINGTKSPQDNPASNATLRERRYANKSRNPLIDEQIKPGPYKEILPCEDLCYDIVQSCPAALGFACPLSGKGLERSYGKRSTDGSVKCSYLGAVVYRNGAPAQSIGFLKVSRNASSGFWMWVAAVAGFLLVV